jgi:hypothetical protein
VLSPIPIFNTLPSEKLISMPWRLVDIRDGGRTLVLYYVTGDAGDVSAAGFRVTNTATSVELTAVSRDRRGSAGDASVRFAVGTLTLPSPLAGRALLHAPTDHGWQLP